MTRVTLNAFFDELTKIAALGDVGGMGRAMNVKNIGQVAKPLAAPAAALKPTPVRQPVGQHPTFQSWANEQARAKRLVSPQAAAARLSDVAAKKGLLGRKPVMKVR